MKMSLVLHYQVAAYIIFKEERGDVKWDKE